MAFVRFHNFNTKVGHFGYVPHDFLHVVFDCPDKQLLSVFAHEDDMILDEEFGGVFEMYSF